MNRRNSILFVRPDYHCSFFYRNELRKQGIKADIFVESGYPSNLLFSKKDILFSPLLRLRSSKIKNLLNEFVLFFWWHTIFWKYDVHIYYGNSSVFSIGKYFDKYLPIFRSISQDFHWDFFIAKLFGIKLVVIPTGCYDSDLKATFESLDNGNVCNNCGFYDRCDDRYNSQAFKNIRNYFQFAIGGEYKMSKEMNEEVLKYKVIDLNLWCPNLEIPVEHVLPKTNNLRILHSAYLDQSGRNWKGKNIKGSPFVLAAIERLKEEGYAVEYYYVSGKPSNQMRYYQAQADIVVEQLIYGWWGSTGVETMALGKPVICYLRPSWKRYFLQVFPEYKDVPVISATVDTVYDELKKLIENKALREKKGKESRAFAEQHFDPAKNTKSLINLLETI